MIVLMEYNIAPYRDLPSGFKLKVNRKIINITLLVILFAPIKR